MKSATPALVTYLNGLRPTSDAPLQAGDLFTIWLANGSILTYTDLDLPVAWNGYVYSASSVLVSGLRYKGSLGVNVDQQKIAISARQTDTLGGIPFLQALQQGAFDGAIIQREKAFFSSWATTGGSLVPIGTAIMFKGRVAAIDDIGRTTAQITVAADTVFLDIDMPRRLWSPQCTHVLYDSGCGLARGTFSASGTVSGSSNLTTITWTGATSAYAQGVLVFTSGANEGVTATIKYADAGQLALAYPLPNVPAVGDAFTAAQGCDHTMATCLGKFRNLSNFRGYPYVPPPQVMTGPLSASWNQGQVWQSSPVAFTLAELGLALYDGSTPQAVWPYLAATYPSQALTYPGTAYCCAASWWLGASGGINSNNFEVYGILAGSGFNVIDADPAYILYDFLTSSQYGVGFPAGSISSDSLYNSAYGYQTYCKAVGIAFSPVLNSTEKASSILSRWLQLSNSTAIWSDGMLKVIPFGNSSVTGNGVTFTPNTTQLYSLRRRPSQSAARKSEYIITAGTPSLLRRAAPWSDRSQPQTPIYHMGSSCISGRCHAPTAR